MKKSITIGVMGRLDKSKGFSYAVKAIKKLAKISDKKFYLKISGSGEKQAYLQNLVKELQLEDRVEFLGWTEKKKFFQSIDIFCLTSLEETFGLVLLEAMKYRKPIIATNVDGPKEILRDKIDGFLISIDPLSKIENRLVIAIFRMIILSDVVDQMLENSFARLKEKFSYQALEERMREIVGKIQ